MSDEEKHDIDIDAVTKELYAVNKNKAPTIVYIFGATPEEAKENADKFLDVIDKMYNRERKNK